VRHLSRTQVQEELQALGEKGERYEDGYIRKDSAVAAAGAMDSEIDRDEVRRDHCWTLIDSLFGR
jgi:hypothetical protein